MKSVIFLLVSVIIPGFLYSQSRDAAEFNVQDIKWKEMNLSRESNISIAGIFISPNVGISFPMIDFSENSRAAFSYGGKVEFASYNLYPFVIGAFYQQQKYPGSEDFKALYRLNTVETKITQFGGGVDIILSRVIPTYFTIPFATLEVSMMNIERTVTPAQNNPGLLLTDNKVGITGGLGFTLFIFDFTGKYTYAGEYSSFSVGTRFRFPLVKF